MEGEEQLENEDAEGRWHVKMGNQNHSARSLGKSVAPRSWRWWEGTSPRGVKDHVAILMFVKHFYPQTCKNSAVAFLEINTRADFKMFTKFHFLIPSTSQNFHSCSLIEYLDVSTQSVFNF